MDLAGLSVMVYDYAYFCSHIIRGGVCEKKCTIINKCSFTKGWESDRGHNETAVLIWDFFTCVSRGPFFINSGSKFGLGSQPVCVHLRR